MEFAPFDRRRYPTLAVRDGYREWAETYEDVVQDEMDLRLLARLESVDWASAGWRNVMTGVNVFGKMCLEMIVQLLTPIARAALT